MKKRKFRDYQEKFIQDLQDPDMAIMYLNEALLDKDSRIFLLALKNIYEAQGEEMTMLARKKDLISSEESTNKIAKKILMK